MEKTWKPTTAGIMTIITGAWGIFIGVVLLLLSGLISGLSTLDLEGMLEGWQGGAWMGPSAADIPDMAAEFLGIGTMIFLVIGIIILVFGIIALVGGISAIKRRRWGLALAGSILSLFLIPIGPILGILAIIFVSLGKGEFE
jgi:hypothetical protein